MKTRWIKTLCAALAVFLLSSMCFMLNSNAFAVSGITEVAVYKDNALTNQEAFTDVGAAWNKAMSYANSSNKVSITLGDNWSHDNELGIPSNSNVTLDLNGYYIKRNRNCEFKDNGGVFYVNKGATFTIKDSRPNTRGYDGVEGGVITGGASGDTAGGIHMCENSSVYMLGGTIYECQSRYNGGAICADEGSKNLELRNCRIYFCQTRDSADNCYGGAIYIKNNEKTVIENALIDSNYCEDDGGAIHFTDKGGTLYMNNVIFSNNKANEQGGAIYVGSLSGSKASDIKAVNCIFVNNASVDEGGAVYVNGRDADDKRPTLFTGCTFKMNSSEDTGGAIYVNKDSVAITDSAITENKSKKKGGGVYVDSYYDLSIKGSLVIRDNESEDTRHNNLCLQEGIASTARVYSGGLYRDSYIVVSTTDDETHFARNISEYQARYFHADNGNFEFDKKDTVNTPLYATLFGNGSRTVIICVVALGIIIAIVAIILKKKGDKKNVKA